MTSPSPDNSRIAAITSTGVSCRLPARPPTRTWHDRDAQSAGTIPARPAVPAGRLGALPAVDHGADGVPSGDGGHRTHLAERCAHPVECLARQLPHAAGPRRRVAAPNRDGARRVE